MTIGICFLQESEGSIEVTTQEKMPITRGQFYTMKDVGNYLKMGGGACGFVSYALVIAANFLSFVVVSYLVGVW